MKNEREKLIVAIAINIFYASFNSLKIHINVCIINVLKPREERMTGETLHIQIGLWMHHLAWCGCGCARNGPSWTIWCFIRSLMMVILVHDKLFGFSPSIPPPIPLVPVSLSLYLKYSRNRCQRLLICPHVPVAPLLIMHKKTNASMLQMDVKLQIIWILLILSLNPGPQQQQTQPLQCYQPLAGITS